ncbi:MAG: 2-amino-4-hydroxy-6-hydroxymethyldihydropteridine diphosphokinase [Paludibacteraceae bacterium]
MNMIYYLSLGANLGERERTIQQAIKNIEQQIGNVLRCSSFYYSKPWGFESKNDFCNLCCAVGTAMPPLEVLARTQSIERTLGRTEKTIKGNYSDRLIDIDLIRVFNGEVEIFMNDDTLTLPHKDWQQRDFVRIPLQEIANPDTITI